MGITEKVSSASKWSLATQLLSKLMGPITNMFLARLLAPEAFGMVATITMITSFSDIFTDAGFQKYLVQQEFKDESDLDDHTNVAFWTNFSLSLLIWAVIFFFRHPLARAVGNAGLGNSLAVAALAVPLTSFSSIQMARYRRALDFRTLFFAKMLGILVPLLVTVPLAFLLRSYWALIIGNLCMEAANAILLTVRSTWKPSFFYSFEQLKNMFAFSIWTLTEQLLGWANLNIGIFIVGKFLSDYYLGLYKTSMASGNQIMLLLVYALSPVLLSALSRLKENRTEYDELFYKFEEIISVIILPLGVGVYVYRKLFTLILLGSQWGEAADFIGLWSMLSAMMIVFGYFSMEIFVSLGKPRYCVLGQLLELLVLVPVLLITAKKGFHTLYVARSLIKLWCICIELTLLKKFAQISPLRILKGSWRYLVVSLLMGVLGYALLRLSENVIWQVGSVFICIVFYFGVLYFIPRTRETLLELKKMAVARKLGPDCAEAEPV